MGTVQFFLLTELGPMIGNPHKQVTLFLCILYDLIIFIPSLPLIA